MLLIINWDASVLLLSGIRAMHWLSKWSRAMLLPPQNHIQFQCLEDCSLLQKHKQQGCFLFCKGKHLCMFMQILHILHSEKLPNPEGSLW